MSSFASRATLLYWFAAITLIVDAIINITIVSLILHEMPFKHSKFLGRREITISDRLERLVDCTGNLGKIARLTSKQLNRFAPSGVHIRNFKGN